MSRHISLLIAISALWSSSCSSSEMSSLSPNLEYRALLRERHLPGAIDYNFEVRVTDKSNRINLRFRSPDEGPPTGSERFIWSKDSRYVLLVGKRFFVKDGKCLPTGEKLYLLMDMKSKVVSCNSSQVKQDSMLDVSRLSEIEFVDSISICTCESP
jgi:hypothetical protein